MLQLKYFPLSLLLVALLFSMPVSAQTGRIAKLERLIDWIENSPRMGTVNPAFKKYVERLKNGDEAYYTGEGMPNRTGYVPPLFKQTLLLPEESMVLANEDLPAQFDLRPDGVTPAKNQGQCGSCWAFTAIGALESSVKLQTGNTYDFSENHLKNSVLPDNDPCGGGNFYDLLAYAASWKGPVAETDDPYEATSANSSPTGLSPKRYVTNMIDFPGHMAMITRDQIKKYIMTYGAVASSLVFDQAGDAYNPQTNAYYYKTDETWLETNHAVLLVGWDDTFSADNFNGAPDGDGAWIAKNSWGEEWGDNGFYYVSYYDVMVGFEAGTIVDSVPASAFDHSYIHLDEDGFSNMAGDGDHDWVAVTHTATRDEFLKGIGFRAYGANCEYTATVFKNQTEGAFLSGEPQTPVSASFESSGYYSIMFDDIPVTSGEIFTVELECYCPDYEDPGMGTVTIPSVPSIMYFSESEAPEGLEAGQAYYSEDGEEWIDFYDPEAEYFYVAAGVRVYASSRAGDVYALDEADTEADTDQADSDTAPTDTDDATTDTEGTDSADGSDTESDQTDDDDDQSDESASDSGCGCQSVGHTTINSLFRLIF